MAKAKSAKVTAAISLEFPRTGIPWIDAGTVGLERILCRRPSYVRDVPLEFMDEVPGSSKFPNISASLEHDRLVITGPPDELQRCLERAYDCLIECYFNLSTEKQRQDRTAYNFYFDSRTQEFESFPKRRAAGAALLLFDKAARPAGDQERWGDDPQTGKRTPGRMPEHLVHLQPKLDEFLQQHGLKAGPPAGLLIDAGNEVRPKIKIQVKSKQRHDPDFLTGDPQAGLSIAKNTAFPLFGGSRSFVNETSDYPRIGWQMDFVGKFVPAVSFFYTQGEDLYIFFPESSDLQRSAELVNLLQSMWNPDPNLYRNFDLSLGGYFAGRSEVTLAFLYQVFLKLTEERRSEIPRPPSDPTDDEPMSFGDESDAEDVADPETDQTVSAQAVYDATLRGAPVNFAVVAARKKGNVWMGRDFWTFTDPVYLARLFERMHEKHRTQQGMVRRVCHPKRLMHSLVDFEAAKDKSLLRDQVCDAILQKRRSLRLLERHAFRLFREWEPGRPGTIGPLLDFAQLYEVELRKGSDMDQTYQKMVETARWLGDNIGTAVARAVLGQQTGENQESSPTARQKESPGRAKGNMFRLRNTRTTGDFVTELARLQLRYRIDVPRDVLDGITLSPETFDDFRGFCVIAALNRFQYLTRPNPKQNA